MGSLDPFASSPWGMGGFVLFLGLEKDSVLGLGLDLFCFFVLFWVFLLGVFFWDFWYFFLVFLFGFLLFWVWKKTLFWVWVWGYFFCFGGILEGFWDFFVLFWDFGGIKLFGFLDSVQPNGLKC